MNKKKLIRKLKKYLNTKSDMIEKYSEMIQEYSELVDRQAKTIESLFNTSTELIETQQKYVDFDGEVCPIVQLAKILTQLNDHDWTKLGIETRLHLLNNCSEEWKTHGTLASRFATIESIIMHVAQVEEARNA